MQKTPRPTAAEAAEAGKAARAVAPRSAHAEWYPAPHRRDPADVLQAEAVTRIPALVPIRYGRMLQSPFAFFRGGAAIMARDLSTTPTTGLRAQLCGDAHLANFGGFAAPDRTIVFDLNDFDETLPGPWEWDVKRFAASIAVAGRDRGFKRGARRAAVLAGVREYRLAMRRFAGMRTVDVWYQRLEVKQQFERWAKRAKANTERRLKKDLAKARAKDSLRALEKLTHTVDGEPRIISDPPLVVPIEDFVDAGERPRIEEDLHRLFAVYRESLPADRRHLLDGYVPVHIAHKVVGVGSVGARAFILLLLGRDSADPLFLQIKEARPSVLEPFLEPSRFLTAGQRVVEGQRLMQAAGDILLGWLHVERGLDGRSRDFYVRQLWDAKGSARIDAMAPEELKAYAEVCGWTLARAHARSGDRIAIAAYLGGGDRLEQALAAFAETYADQNERDFGALMAAVQAGRIKASTAD